MDIIKIHCIILRERCKNIFKKIQPSAYSDGCDIYEEEYLLLDYEACGAL